MVPNNIELCSNDMGQSLHCLTKGLFTCMRKVDKLSYFSIKN